MRKLLLTCTTAMFLGLAGCTTTQVTDFLGQVQADAAAACLFVPTIETILNVAASLGIPVTAIVGSAVNTVASAICAQVPPPSSARYLRLNPTGVGPAVNIGTLGGVPINGWRTK